MRCRKASVLLVFLLLLLLSGTAYGSPYQPEDPEIPLIAKWKEGHGFGEDGRRFYDGWAFDPENGSYVRFLDGSVAVKADYILDTEDYAAFFTDTEAAAGTLAVRGEVMKHFAGTIRVVVEDMEAHGERTCNLTGDNEYRFNMSVPKGSYRIKEAEAVWNQQSYKVSFREESQEVGQDNTCLIEIRVLPEGDGEDKVEGWEPLDGADLADGEAEDFPPVSTGSSQQKKIESQSMHWPEIYFIIGIFLVAYGLYRFWTKNRR